MNREILFRGKRKDNDEWVYGDLIQIPNGRKFIVNNKFGACIDKDGNFINTEAPFVCEVFPETVGQFTGLCDKNGNKIFEGDILLEEEKEYSLEEYGEKVVGTHNIVAYWNEKACGFWVRRTDKPKGKIYVPEEPLCESFAEELKVVGNIYDNPELLEVEQ
jgi:uncharacterized phage protein (TIGR01671 family)